MLLATPAPAQSARPALAEQPHFGQAGQWVVLASSNGLGLSRETFSLSPAKFLDAGFEVGIDRFVVPRFSIGFDVAASYHDDQGYVVATFNHERGWSASAGVRFGYALPIGNTVSWYPRVTLSLGAAHSETLPVLEGPIPTSQSRIGPAVNLYAPLLLSPAPHFLVGFGPRVEHNFAVLRQGPYDGTQTTLVSGELVVGGWWGGPENDSNDDDTELPLGAKGQVLLTNETAFSGSYLSNSRATRSQTSFAIGPGIDYFAAEDYTFGGSLFVGHSEGTFLDSFGNKVDHSATTTGFAMRGGKLADLSPYVSVWPTFELGYGTQASQQTSVQAKNEHNSTRFWVELKAPVLIHGASHFFVGAGPYIYYELGNTDQFGRDNTAMQLGISFLLGGWL